MALNGNLLGTTIKNTLLAINPDSGLLNGAENTVLETYWQAVANDFEDHYESLMDVLPGSFKTVDVTTGDEAVVGTGAVT